MKTLEDHLQEFYLREGIPNGGIDNKYFSICFLGLNLKLPNVAYRKKNIHIHDLQHVLNQCDTSWKGESYIAGWELATGMWRYPVFGLVSLWTVGYCLWRYPKSIYKGFKKGLNMSGVIDLKMKRQELLAIDLETLQHKTTKTKENKISLLHKLQFSMWAVTGICIFILPFILIMAGVYLMIKLID